MFIHITYLNNIEISINVNDIVSIEPDNSASKITLKVLINEKGSVINRVIESNLSYEQIMKEIDKVIK